MFSSSSTAQVTKLTLFAVMKLIIARQFRVSNRSKTDVIMHIEIYLNDLPG